MRNPMAGTYGMIVELYALVIKWLSNSCFRICWFCLPAWTLTCECLYSYFWILKGFQVNSYPSTTQDHPTQTLSIQTTPIQTPHDSDPWEIQIPPTQTPPNSDPPNTDAWTIQTSPQIRLSHFTTPSPSIQTPIGSEIFRYVNVTQNKKYGIAL